MRGEVLIAGPRRAVSSRARRRTRMAGGLGSVVVMAIAFASSCRDFRENPVARDAGAAGQSGNGADAAATGGVPGGGGAAGAPLGSGGGEGGSAASTAGGAGAGGRPVGTSGGNGTAGLGGSGGTGANGGKGGNIGSGGATGSAAGMGGTAPGTGGVVPGTGGAAPGTGGVAPGTGGVAPGTGGTIAGSGGAMPGTGGAMSGSGGAPGCSSGNCVGVCDAGGVCKSKLGQPCTATPAGCAASTSCVDGVCCGSPTCGACLNCGSAGTCTVKVSGGDDNTGTTCNALNTCDATGACMPRPCAGNSCGPRAVCAAGGCKPARRVFVSAVSLPATFAAPSGASVNVADGLCQGYAAGANLGGTWKVWLSDTTTSPAARLEHASVAYTLVDGTTIANGWSGLVGGAPLLHGIDKDQTGVARPNAEVWTITDSAGQAFLSGGSITFPPGNCSNFTSAAVGPTYPVVGLSSATDSTWSSVYAVPCSTTASLYCFEQGP